MTIQIKEGDIAPDLKLESSEGSEVSLNTFQNKNLVLFFYPKDATPGCTIEANEFNTLLNHFHNLDCIVLGISRDNIQSHKKFVTKQCLNFNLLSDINGETCLNYGVLVEKSMFGKSYNSIRRSTFLIDQNKIISKIWINVNPLGHASKVLQALNLSNRF